MKAYPKYKPSGIEWIGDIPAHWEVKKLKWTMSIKSGDGIRPEEINPNSEYPVFGGNGVMGFTDKYNSDGLELIIGRVGAKCGNVHLENGKKWISDNALIVKTFNNKLFLRTYLEALNLNKLANQNAQPLITGTMIKDQMVAWPPANEQDALCKYLLYKTGCIDSIIKKKTQLIELLQEEKTAVINEAVTKGLNPDVKMKDIGIPWLGVIPAHWKLRKIKYIASITLGKMLTNDDKGGYKLKPYLRAQNIGWLKVNSEDIKDMWFSEYEMGKLRLNRNDLLVSEGGEVGRTCIWKEEIEECYIQNSVHKISFGSNNLPHYYLYLFYFYGMAKYFDSIINKISIGHLTGEKLKEIIVLVPPYEEQAAIVKHISQELLRIENIEASINKEINLLQEYRTSLISEAVTGKIDVREYNVPV